MENTAVTGGAEDTNATSENHRKAASHLISAAAHHYKAANFISAGDTKNASDHTALAKQYFDLANEARGEIV